MSVFYVLTVLVLWSLLVIDLILSDIVHLLFLLFEEELGLSVASVSGRMFEIISAVAFMDALS